MDTRTAKPESRFVTFADFEVDLAAWIVRRNQRRVALQRKPFQILRLLVSRPGELISRAELARELWPDLHVSYDRCLNTAMNALRTALGDPTHRSALIETRPGLGYCFVGAIKTDTAAAGKSDAAGGERDLLLGYYFLHRLSEGSLVRARACFLAALEVSPASAAAQVGLAELENLQAIFGHVPTREACGQALRHARAAEASDPGAETRIVLAVASALDTGNYEQAIQVCRSSNEIAPPAIATYGLGARIWLAEFLSASGRVYEALEQLSIARQANPTSLLILCKLSLASYLAADYPGASELAWSALSIEPASGEAHYALALACEAMRRGEDAVTEFENALASSHRDPPALAGLCHALYGAARSEEGSEVATRLEETARTVYVSPCWRALVDRASGHRERADRWLSVAAESGDHLLAFARYDPRFRC